MYDPIVVDTFAENLVGLTQAALELGPESPALRQIAELNNPAARSELQQADSRPPSNATAIHLDDGVSGRRWRQRPSHHCARSCGRPAACQRLFLFWSNLMGQRYMSQVLQAWCPTRTRAQEQNSVDESRDGSPQTKSPLSTQRPRSIWTRRREQAG